MKLRFAVLLTALSAVTACGSDAKKAAPAAPPSSATVDASSTTPVVFLRPRLEGDRVFVDVVARDVSEVHGIAFRLAYDSAKLGYVDAHGSAIWSDRALALAKEGAAGELVVTWSERGSVPGHPALDETTLGTITLASKAPDADISFRPERSTIRDVSGNATSVDWRGARVGP